MLAAILALLQEGHTAASETAEHAGATAEHAEPWLVEQANHILGPAVLSIERVVMPRSTAFSALTGMNPPTASWLYLSTSCGFSFYLLSASPLFCLCEAGCRWTGPQKDSNCSK